MRSNDTSTRRRFAKRAGVAVAGLAGLAGCTGSGGGGDGGSGGSSGSDSDSDSGSGSGSTEGTTTGSSGSSGSTTIRWWHAMGGNLGETVKRLASDYTEQSDGVTVQPSYKGSYYETLNATTSAIKAGNAPAVAQILDLGATLAIDSGAFQPIGEVMSDRLDWSRYHDPVLSYYTFDDTVHSLPFNSSNPVLYINEDKFEEAGLDPSDPPANFAEVREAAQALVESGATEKGIGFANVSWFPEQWFAEDDQVLVDEQNGRAGAADEIFLENDTSKRIFQWWSDMYDDGLYLHPGKGAWGAAQQAFINQKVGMHISSTAGVAGTTEGAQEAGFGLRTAYYPVPNAGTRTGVVIGGASLWLTEGLSSAKQDAATDFFAWLSEPEQQAAWHRGTGYFPITKDAVGLLESEGWFEENPNFRTAFDQLNDTEVTPATQGFQVGPSSEIRNVIQDGYISMINSDVGVDEKLSQMKQEGDELLRQYNRKTS